MPTGNNLGDGLVERLRAARISPAQYRAIAWLHTNGGLRVPNMNMHGSSREWPKTRTLRKLIDLGLIDFTQGQLEWGVAINDAGRAALRAQASQIDRTMDDG